MEALLAAAGYVALGVTAVLALIALLLVVELSKAPPKGGSPYALPNGMTIQHWQKAETDFLYTEIWGAESAYSHRGGLVFRPGATVLDAGANIGMFSLYAAAACQGAARIVSFEPIKPTYDVMAANMRAAAEGRYASVFGGKPGALRVEPLNVGLSDKPADVVFEHHPHFTVWSTQDAAFADQRLERITADMPRALDSSPNWLVRNCFPRVLARLLAGLVLRRKLGKTERQPVKLVTLSSVIDDLKIDGPIDLLKIDVEGAEIAVLKGITTEAHWARVQQAALEVENFAAKDTVVAMLQAHGFETSWFASERERNPGVQSEVCMVYGIRPEYRAKYGGAAEAAAPAAEADEAAAKPAAAGSGARSRKRA